MADAGSTVRGTIDLNVGPARRALRELRAEAQRTDATMGRLDRSIDRVGRQRQQVRGLREEFRALGSDVRRSEGTMTQSMRRKTEAVQRQRQAVRSLRQDVRMLGREKAVLDIDHRGLDRAIRQIDVLINRLQRLSRMRATPRVGLGGGIATGAAAGAGSGFLMGRGAGGGGGGGFGNRGGMLRSISLGPLNINPRGIGVLAAVALPSVQALSAALVGLVTSLGAAVAGFGALGTAAAGAASVGLGSIAAIAMPVTKQLGEVWKAQETLAKQQQNSVAAGEMQRANLERVRGAHETLASAQRGALYAQERLTLARKDARRELINMALAADRSVLSESRARLAVRQSLERLREVDEDPRATDLDRADARLSVREARLGVREARTEGRFVRQDYRERRRQGVGGAPQVVEARRGVAESRRQLVNARRGLREAGAEMARGATQIASAKEDLDQAFSRAPRGTRQLLADVRELRALWGAGTETTRGRARDPGVRAAQEEFVGILSGTVGTVREMTPTLGRAGLKSARAMRREGSGVGRFLRSRRTAGLIGVGATMFDENLGAWTRSTTNIAETLLNITRASRPFLREASDFIEAWTRGWRDSTRDIEGTRRSIREMVDHFRSWRRLVAATWDLLMSLGRAGGGARSGMGLVDSLTAQMREWDRWVQRNPRQVRQFFSNAADSVRDMASALREVVQMLSQIAELLRPMLDNFTTLIAGAGALGMLQPGALALGYGAIRGARGRGAAAAAGGGGMVGVAPPMRGGAAGAAAGQARFSARTGYVPYGGPVSQLGPRRGPLGRLGGGLGRAGMGALRFGGPSMALIGLLSAMGTEGSVGTKVHGGFSALSMGLLPGPRTQAQQQERGRRIFEDFMGTMPFGRARQERGAFKQIERRMLEANLTVPAGTDPDVVRFKGTEFSREEWKTYTQSLRDEWKSRRAVIEQLDREREQRRRERQRERGRSSAVDIQEAYGIRARGAGPAEAMRRAVDQTLRTQRRLAPEGAKIVAEANLAWAQQQARSNPELLGEVERLERGIKRRFSRLGKHVQVVNGQILTGSQREWKGISDAIIGRAERARQEASEEFTRLQQKAVGSLRAMGFTPSQARRLVQGMEEGGKRGKAAQRVAEHGSAVPFSPEYLGTAMGRGNARGGRLEGRGLRDTVPLAAAGNLGAPGEVIANRHTEQRVNRMLWTGGFTTTLGREAQREQRAHYQQHRPVDGQPMGRVGRRARGFQRGGIVPVPGFPGERAASYILDEIALIANRFGLTLTDAFGPGHKSPGHTVRGDAADFAGPDARMDAAVRFLVSKGYLVGYDGRFGSQRWSGHGPTSVAGGNAHLHVEFGRKDIAGARGAGVPGMMDAQGVKLRARRSALGGVPGALSTRAGQMYAAGLQRKINETLGAGGGPGGGGLGGFTGGGSAAANKRLGRQMMLRLWGPDQWSALHELWMRESGWDHTAVNPSSGAWGIPQSLPGSKMASAGADWRTNPATQIRWGLRYIRGRYGSPASALGFHNSHNWYGRGGRFQARKPQLFGAGDRQPTGGSEQVTVRRVGPGGQLRDNATGAGGIVIQMNFGDVTVHGQHDLNALLGKAADHAAERLLRALERAGVTSDAALAGG